MPLPETGFVFKEQPCLRRLTSEWLVSAINFCSGSEQFTGLARVFEAHAQDLAANEDEAWVDIVYYGANQIKRGAALQAEQPDPLAEQIAEVYDTYYPPKLPASASEG